MLSLRQYLMLGAAIACFAAGWLVNGLIWQHRSDNLLEEQKSLLIGQCKDQKKTTEEVDNATLKKMRTRDDRIAEYKRMHPTARCVPVTPASGNRDAAGGGSVDDRPHAVADYSLVDFAAIAERYRVQLVGCQSFINRVWDSQ